MRCPKCTSIEDKVIDSRISREGTTIRRRRECLECGHRYTTTEMIVREDLIMIAEYEGEPVAFMLTWSNINEVIKPFKGKLLPFNWLKLLKWLRNPQTHTMRVPLMGVRKDLQNSRMASQLAFMMIEFIRRNAVARYGATRGEIGWILEDNQGMVAIADAIDSKVNREYRIYEKPL